MGERLLFSEREILLRAARNAIRKAVTGLVDQEINIERVPERLKKPGATFVTLSRKGALRGCVGALNPTKSLFDDVCEHAVAAAMDDYRFPPLQPEEVDEVQIEISVISETRKLQYSSIEELLNMIRPGIDGVIIKEGGMRATFLPQVWLKIPEKEQFLNHLCQKMGAPADLWKKMKVEILTYQVEEFSEN